MPVINFSSPLQIFVALILFVLVLWFSLQSKKSAITAIMLFTFVTILVWHVVELTLGQNLEPVEISVLIHCIIFDLIFVFLSFISYLWVDDVEAKVKKKKVISNSLDWFWEKV